VIRDLFFRSPLLTSRDIFIIIGICCLKRQPKNRISEFTFAVTNLACIRHSFAIVTIPQAGRKAPGAPTRKLPRASGLA
jgi:hypothetical protein